MIGEVCIDRRRSLIAEALGRGVPCTSSMDIFGVPSPKVVKLLSLVGEGSGDEK